MKLTCNLSERDNESVIVHEEFFENLHEVSEQDIIEYSQRLDINLQASPKLATVVRDWILQPLPRYWFPCHDTRTGHWFYCNALNGFSSWQHPLEEIHRSLAKEYCETPNFRGSVNDRGNPEGESAEPSMEASSLSSPTYRGSLQPSKNHLPRALAPLKRIPKIEPISSSKNILNPIESIQDKHNLVENVKELNFSTFKPSDPPVSSLLPSDQLFEKSNRPASASIVNRSLLPRSTILLVTDNKLGDVVGSSDAVGSNDEVVLRTPAKEPFNYPPVLDKISNNNASVLDQRVVKNISVDNEEVTNFGTPSVIKPIANLSFTERLAAKKASRSKVPEPHQSCTSNSSISLDSGRNDFKKHVQFDLETQQVRHYTPECSEETSKAVDKSESSSSEDFLDFIGDPVLLKPLSDPNSFPINFEEKRWDVSFTSFGVVSTPSDSPVKLQVSTGFDGHVYELESDEMITRFNSEFCPSPLSLTTSDLHESRVSDTIEKCEPVLHSNVLDSDFALTDIPQVVTASMPVLNPDPYQDSSLQDIKPLEEVTIMQVPIKPSSHVSNTLKEPDRIKLEIDTTACIDTNNPPGLSQSSQGETPDQVAKQEDVQHPEPIKRARPPTLTRSVTRSDSLETSVLPIPTKPVIIQEVVSENSHPSTAQLELVEQDSSHHFVENPSPLSNRNIDPLSRSVNQVPPSAHINPPIPLQRKAIEIPPSTEASESVSSVMCERVRKDAPTMSETNNSASLDDWLRLKKEMEKTLEMEKTKLECWFNREIAQIKTQFESELASERRRTEDLSKLVESTKGQKEELARAEMFRLEENIARLVEEKSRQVQSQLLSATVNSQQIAQRQDAKVQTETEPVVISTTERKIPFDEPTASNRPRGESCSNSESQVPFVPRREPRIKCQCDSLQRQVARVEREMQLLKQKNIAFQKSPSTKMRKSAPVKARRESWWMESDESTESTASSLSDWRVSSNGRSRSLTDLHAGRELNDRRSATPVQRARGLLYKNQIHRRAWMEDVSTDRSSDTPTSGISSAMSTSGHEWDTVLNSIQKISGDLREVWSHLGQRPPSLTPSMFTSKNQYAWMSSKPSYQDYNSRIPLHWSLSGSTVERTQALRLWLQQNNQHSQPFL